MDLRGCRNQWFVLGVGVVGTTETTPVHGEEGEGKEARGGGGGVR